MRTKTDKQHPHLLHRQGAKTSVKRPSDADAVINAKHMISQTEKVYCVYNYLRDKWKWTLPVHEFRTWPFLLSPGWHGHTYPDIGQWWDSSGATRKPFNARDPTRGSPVAPWGEGCCMVTYNIACGTIQLLHSDVQHSTHRIDVSASPWILSLVIFVSPGWDSHTYPDLGLWWDIVRT
uniref:Uncharacterized protein n=1 Tax=Romanomermis culicivorax TaxID=13658 RepID=A0A915JHJ4_ROMCU